MCPATDVNFVDFNGDGIEDLVLSNNTDGTINLILDRLAGSYSVLGPIKIGNNPYSAAVGDLDHDSEPAGHCGLQLLQQ
ncbi:MAG: VCBS repeat-containing protein [Silvibacterium sp.]